MTERRDRRVAWWFLALTAATALLAAGSSAWLTARYRPSVAQAWDLAAGPEATQRAGDVQEAALGVLAGLALVLAAVVVTPPIRRRFRTSWWSVAGGIGVLIATLVAGATRRMLEWEQLALWSVSVGRNVRGYWAAAFGDDVRFVIVDGTEVDPSRYAAVLGVHLLALVAVLVGLGLVAADLRRRPAAEPAQNSRSVVDSMPRSSS